MTTVLVAGGTGMLGSRIADYLVKETGVQVRLLVRDGWEDDDAKRQRVDPRCAFRWSICSPNGVVQLVVSSLATELR
jgi:nucleoside-diphosphate-sugar epimerase